jgi:hypothetical protein
MCYHGTLSPVYVLHLEKEVGRVLLWTRSSWKKRRVDERVWHMETMLRSAYGVN